MITDCQHFSFKKLINSMWEKNANSQPTYLELPMENLFDLVQQIFTGPIPYPFMSLQSTI